MGLAVAGRGMDAGEMKLLDRIRTALRGDGVLVLLFGLLLVAYIAYGTQLRGGLLSDVVGPRTYPILLGVLGLGLVVLFFVQKLAARTDETEQQPGLTLAGEMPHLVPFALTIVYALVLTTLGYVLATAIYAAVIVKMLGQRTWLGAAVFGIILTATSYLLFTYAFEVRLPPSAVLPGNF